MLGKCTECGHEVSYSAKECPNCGTKYPTNRFQRGANAVANQSMKMGCVILLIGLVVTAALGGC